MGNKRALAASAEETTAKALSSQSDECEIAAKHCSLHDLRVISSRNARPGWREHGKLSQRLP